jgi:predicted RNA-binding protein YlxR (DUF448 family)
VVERVEREREAKAEASAAEHPKEAPRDPETRSHTRMCVGCGQRVPVPDELGDLVRLVLGPGGQVVVDARGGGFGRGAHVHARRGCLERAVARGLPRAANGRPLTAVLPASASVGPNVDDDATAADSAEPLSVATLARAIQVAMNRRAAGLLAAAARGRHVARGADAVSAAWDRGEAKLVLVACDAAASADLRAVRCAIAVGSAVAWSTKQKIAAVLGGGNVDLPGTALDDVGGGTAVVAITSDALARAVRAAVQSENAAAALAMGRDGLGTVQSHRPRRKGGSTRSRTRTPDGNDGNEARSGLQAGVPVARPAPVRRPPRVDSGGSHGSESRTEPGSVGRRHGGRRAESRALSTKDRRGGA